MGQQNTNWDCLVQYGITYQKLEEIVTLHKTSEGEWKSVMLSEHYQQYGCFIYVIES